MLRRWAEVAPEATGTEAGTVNAVLLLEKDTTAPLAGAARFRVTVQVLVALDVRTEGLQETPVGMEPDTRLSEKTVEEPDRDAMMVAVLSEVIVEAVAVNVAEVAPEATVTETGKVNEVVLMDKLTREPPVGAALLSVTVQVVEVLEVSVSGAQMRLVGTVFVTRLSEKVTEEPDSDAVMTAVLLVVIVEAVAVKLAEVAPAATVTEAGTVNAALLSDRETREPPVGAALLSVTVQVAEVLEVREAGLQERLVGTAFVTRFMEKVTEEPDRDAVMTAVLSAVMVEAVAEKVAEVAPAATVTEAGTVNAALLSDRETREPPMGAALLSVTVQVAEVLEVREAGLQERLVGTAFVTRFMEKVTEEPERDAVMTAVLSAVMVEAVAEKVAEVAPAATVTEAGTVSAALLSDRETREPPVGAALLSVTVQVAEVLEVREAGLQERLVGTVFVTRFMEKVTEEPESDAVMTAVLLAVMVEAVAEKVAEVAPAATVTEAGTVSAALLSDKETTAPPVGAALLRVTVQVEEALEVSEVGLQERLVGTVFVTRFMEKVTEEPERDAVMTAVLSAVMVEAVAEKVAEVAPAATVTEAGTVSAALLSDKETTAPPVGAALLRVTVQVEEALEVSEVGLQERLVGTVFVTRLREKVTEEPESDAVMTAVLLVVIVEAVAEKVAEVAPAATVTEAGTVNKALFLDRETTAPPAGAGLLRATVQVLLAPEVRAAGVQLRPVSRVGASRLTEKVAVLPATEAVMVAEVLAVTRPELAEKVAEEEPAGMVMEAGTVTRELLLERVTTVPPAGAA